MCRGRCDFALLASSIKTEKGLVANGFSPSQDADYAKNRFAETKERFHAEVTGGEFSDITALGGRILVKAPSVTFDGLLQVRYDGLDFNGFCMVQSILSATKSRQHIRLESLSDFDFISKLFRGRYKEDRGV